MYTHTCRVREVQCALVRWYKVVTLPKKAPRTGPARDVLALHDYIKLQWATSGPKAEPVFEVLPLACIVRREYVVPDFSTWKEGGAQPKFYYVSRSKWDRSVKDESVCVGEDGGEVQPGSAHNK